MSNRNHTPTDRDLNAVAVLTTSWIIVFLYGMLAENYSLVVVASALVVKVLYDSWRMGQAKDEIRREREKRFETVRLELEEIEKSREMREAD